jgi:hypothetical protein
MSRRCWKLLAMASGGLVALAGGCGTGLRDAILAGAFDFVSGSTAELLGTAFGIAAG